MGHLKNGVWQSTAQTLAGAAFKRESSGFYSSASGLLPLTDSTPGRLSLISSKACPWSHYAFLIHQIAGLDSHINVAELAPIVGDQGWSFKTPFDLGDAQQAYQLHQVYSATSSTYSGRVTSPVLYDSLHRRIVSNDSLDIGITFVRHLARFGSGKVLDIYPAALQHEVDNANIWIYEQLANKVYEIGFCANQSLYERNLELLFSALDRLENLLASSSYVCGDRLTIADLRLFTFLIRFDPVYFVHFKCSRRMLREMPNISRYLKGMMAIPRVAGTVSISEIKDHYYLGHRHLNPSGLVPGTLLLGDSSG